MWSSTAKKSCVAPNIAKVTHRNNWKLVQCGFLVKLKSRCTLKDALIDYDCQRSESIIDMEQTVQIWNLGWKKTKNYVTAYPFEKVKKLGHWDNQHFLFHQLGDHWYLRYVNNINRNLWLDKTLVHTFMMDVHSPWYTLYSLVFICF